MLKRLATQTGITRGDQWVTSMVKRPARRAAQQVETYRLTFPTQSNACRAQRGVLQGDMPVRPRIPSRSSSGVPSHWPDEADALASTMTVSWGARQLALDAFREAMRRGFKQLRGGGAKARLATGSPLTTVATARLFWFGPDKQTAIATADRLARRARGLEVDDVRGLRREGRRRRQDPTPRTPIYSVLLNRRQQRRRAAVVDFNEVAPAAALTAPGRRWLP